MASVVEKQTAVRENYVNEANNNSAVGTVGKS